MFRKYEKTYRIDSVPGKAVLPDRDVKSLFAGEVIIEEKMDGANAGIIRHKNGFHLQKRGSLVGQSEHEQFGFFHNWANQQNYEKIMNIPSGFLIYGELLYAVHTIYYDKLPDYFLVFDVYENNVPLNYDDRTAFCQKYQLHEVPFITCGYFGKIGVRKLIPDASKYGNTAEGIVIKRYAKNNYLRAKIVKPEFIKAIEEADDHWSHFAIKRNKCI